MARDRGTEDFEHESLQDCQSIVKYLEAVRQGFSDGELVFASGEDEIVLEPQGLVQFSVHVKRRDDRVKVTLKTSWKEKAPVISPGERLVITAGSRDTE